jgi:hypothetical protein
MKDERISNESSAEKLFKAKAEFSLVLLWLCRARNYALYAPQSQYLLLILKRHADLSN